MLQAVICQETSVGYEWVSSQPAQQSNAQSNKRHRAARARSQSKTRASGLQPLRPGRHQAQLRQWQRRPPERGSCHPWRRYPQGPPSRPSWSLHEAGTRTPTTEARSEQWFRGLPKHGAHIALGCGGQGWWWWWWSGWGVECVCGGGWVGGGASGCQTSTSVPTPDAPPPYPPAHPERAAAAPGCRGSW